MFSPDNMNSLMKEVIARLGKQSEGSKVSGMSNNKKNGISGNNGNLPKCKIDITPSQALVIAGLLSNALEVVSVLVDKDQTVQIVLEGSLKQKTELEQMLDQIGGMPFDDVIKAFIDRLT